MIFPINYRPHGNREECEKLRGHGRRLMIVLESIMAAGKTKNQTIRLTPYDGALIVAHKFFGQRIVDIYVGVPLPTPPVEKEQICLCNCNLSVGWILEVQPELVGQAHLYTVMACNHLGRSYIPYYNVLASDFTPYEVGQRVIMIPYNEMAFLCCTDKTGGMDKVRGCSPMINTEELSSDDWRTTYRILPWCMITVPLKIQKGRWNPYE